MRVLIAFVSFAFASHYTNEDLYHNDETDSEYLCFNQSMNTFQNTFNIYTATQVPIKFMELVSPLKIYH